MKHLLWHGNAVESLDRMDDILLDMELIRAHSAAAEKLGCRGSDGGQCAAGETVEKEKTRNGILGTLRIFRRADSSGSNPLTALET